MPTPTRTVFARGVTVFAPVVAAFAFGVTVLALGVAALALGAATPAQATEQASVSSSAQGRSDAVRLAAQEPTQPPDSTLPPGPRIKPEESERATEEQAETKAIVAAVAIGLLVIVIFGHKAHKKSRPGEGS